jgi:hypothetical protein
VAEAAHLMVYRKERAIKGPGTRYIIKVMFLVIYFLQLRPNFRSFYHLNNASKFESINVLTYWYQPS